MVLLLVTIMLEQKGARFGSTGAQAQPLLKAALLFFFRPSSISWQQLLRHVEHTLHSSGAPQTFSAINNEGASGHEEQQCAFKAGCKHQISKT